MPNGRRRPRDLCDSKRAAAILGSLLAALVDAACKDSVAPPAPITVTVVSVPLSAGVDHTCALNRSGVAFCWGLNDQGQLGNGSTTVSPTPVAVSGALTFAAVVASGGAGNNTGGHTCGLTPRGEAYCWGDNSFGQLGTGTSTSSSSPVAVFGGLPFSAITAGAAHTCGLGSHGTAWCWGWASSIPVAVPGGMSFGAITAGMDHTCGLSSGGTAYCWGANTFGELGVGTTTASDVPVRVATALRWAAITAGDEHTCGVTTAGEAYCWGSNRNGELGDATTTGPETCAWAVPGVGGSVPCSTVPVPVTTGLRWASLTAGPGRTCGLTPVGTAYCWGYNGDGELGTGSTATSATPVAVSGGFRFSMLATGGYHTCGLTLTGAIYCWGLNRFGQLGDGSFSDSWVPVGGWPRVVQTSPGHFDVAVGEQLDIVLGTVGPGQYDSLPSVSSPALRFLDMTDVGPIEPAGPTQRFRFAGQFPGQPIVEFHHSFSNLTVTYTVDVR